MPSVVVQAGDVGSGSATVKVYAADGTTLATVYKDANGDDTGANPLPKHKATGYFGLDNAGNFTVYLVPGDYQLGVTPAGGSETKTPFTVVAPVVEVETVFTEVFGTPADGGVPAWNDTTKRFEWSAPSAASSAPPDLLVDMQAGVGTFGVAGSSATGWLSAVSIGSVVQTVIPRGVVETGDYKVDGSGTDTVITIKKAGTYGCVVTWAADVLADCQLRIFLDSTEFFHSAVDAYGGMPVLVPTSADVAFSTATKTGFFKIANVPATIRVDAEGFYNGSGTDPGVYSGTTGPLEVHLFPLG